MGENIYDNIDLGKLTTQERREFAGRLQNYLTYFQKMQKRAEEHNLIDRVVDIINSGEKRKKKEKRKRAEKNKEVL